MRVLGIDPGLTRCGVGVVEGVPGRQCQLVAYYVVYTEPDDDIALRLRHLDESLTQLVADHKPDSVAVERVFSQHNVRTVMGTAQASAVAILAGARARLPVQTYTPSEVKAAVTGSGVAGKAQVTEMVTRILGLDAPPRPADAADALALAICHIWRGGTRTRIQEAAAKQAAAVRKSAARSAAARQAALARDAATRQTAAGGQGAAGGRGVAGGEGGAGRQGAVVMGTAALRAATAKRMTARQAALANQRAAAQQEAERRAGAAGVRSAGGRVGARTEAVEARADRAAEDGERGGAR